MKLSAAEKRQYTERLSDVIDNGKWRRAHDDMYSDDELLIAIAVRRQIEKEQRGDNDGE